MNETNPGFWQRIKALWQSQRSSLPQVVEKIRPSSDGVHRREFVVIGLGRFGSSVARTLVNYGHDVLAIDNDAERVQHLSAELPHIVQLDATNAQSLREIGADEFETGVVCISSDFESNILATVLLHQMGVERIITKASTRTQKTILEAIGAAEVILPEHEAGAHLGRRLTSQNFIDYLEMGEGISIVELIAPDKVCNQSLGACNLRQNYGLTVIAVRRGSQVYANPGANFIIMPGDILVVIGRMENAERLGFARAG